MRFRKRGALLQRRRRGIEVEPAGLTWGQVSKVWFVSRLLEIPLIYLSIVIFMALQQAPDWVFMAWAFELEAFVLGLLVAAYALYVYLLFHYVGALGLFLAVNIFEPISSEKLPKLNTLPIIVSWGWLQGFPMFIDAIVGRFELLYLVSLIGFACIVYLDIWIARKLLARWGLADELDVERS